MTNFEIFNALVNRLLEKGILPKPDQRIETDTDLEWNYNCSLASNNLLDYISFGSWKVNSDDLKPDDCIVHGDLNYGGSEGIYLDLSIMQDGEIYDFGAIKTLSGDRFAMHAMASLLADILIESWDLLNELA